MKITVRDITQNKTADGWCQDLPDEATLGDMFKHSKELAGVVDNIVQTTVNGRRLDAWRDYHPAKGDSISFDIVPREGISLGLVLQIIMAVVAVAQFIVSLFAKPPKPQEQRHQSPTYSFEGMNDTYAPGEPIPVVYGKQRKGGHVLMYYLTMQPNKNGLAMAMLLSMGEGPIAGIDDIEINQLKASDLTSISIETRLGTSSETIVAGFEEMRNTFHDGREISDEFKNGRDGKGADSHIIYRTVGHDVQRAEFFISAPSGLTCIGKSSGEHYRQWSEYQIEYTDGDTNECDEVPWITWGTRKIHGRFERVYWDSFIMDFPHAGRWSVRLTWKRAKCDPLIAHPGLFTYRIFLQDVTEFRGQSPVIRNEPMISIKAAPTKELHGGRPLVTGVVRGLKPDVYTNLTTFTNQWTQNPAWCVADYMTNSRYGMGGYIAKSDLDIQSFIDFATLCDCMIATCEGTAPSTVTANALCDGTDNFQSGDVPAGDGGFSGFDPPECTGMHSAIDGVQQYGICLNRICCPPLDGCYGVFSGEALCEWHENMMGVIRIDTGSPVFGLVAYVSSGSTAENFSGYGTVYNHGSHTLAAVRWNNQSVNTYGTILGTLTYCFAPCDAIGLIIEPTYINWPASRNWYTGDYTDIYMYAQTSAGVTKAEITYTDCSPQRFTKGGCGGIAEQGLNGIIVLPSGLNSGDYHSAHLDFFWHECGVCYGGCGGSAGGCYCDTDGPSSGTIIRHWDDTCQRFNGSRYNETTVRWGNIYVLPN